MALSITTPAAAHIVGESVVVEPQGATHLVAPMIRDGSPAVPLERAHPPGWSPPSTAHDGRGLRHVERPARPLLVHVRPGLVARRHPSRAAKVVGTVATTSRFYGVPLVLWVEAVSPGGTWGRVELPYAWPRTEGWIPLAGLEREGTWIRVEVDLSAHTLRLFKRDRLVLRAAGATGAATSPTPPGDYVVTDRVPFASGSSLGSFAFGISGIQPRLPAGWSGGDQLAIHGTNQPWSIGRSVSAGCIRVSERTLERLKPLLRLGTPVLIRP